MNNGWEHAKELAEKQAAAGSGLFVRLANDGDKVIGAFVGEPYAREVHWNGERYVSCLGEGCTLCEGGKKPSLRVAMNFYVPTERALKVIEGGINWFKDLLKVKDKYGLDKWMFEIERHGEAGNAKTTYTILPEEKLDSAQLKEIAALNLHALPQLVAAEGDSFEPTDQGDRDEPIDARTASALVSRLKALPRDAVDAFLAKFKVQRIRDLKAAEEPAAQAFAATLEARYSQAQTSAAAEVDPFR